MSSLKLFTAVWCTNCQPIKKLIEEKGYAIELIDVDADPAAVRDYGVRGVPCLVVDNEDMVSGAAGILQRLRELFGDHQ